jgi:copper homeostasis protein CutC
MIRSLVERASFLGSRIQIAAGAGIDETNVADLGIVSSNFSMLSH